MNIGQRIAFYRDVLGISQRELAKKSGLTSPAVCQYESGKRVPDLKSFVAICKTLGVKTDKFLEGVDI
ncbi:helix-turn-helix domain-containing protein [Rhodopseudomonas parapalustris]|jgi:transcriptional regulator with XRE-family HTH domain